jgi:hypothetical protein
MSGMNSSSASMKVADIDSLLNELDVRQVRISELAYRRRIDEVYVPLD